MTPTKRSTTFFSHMVRLFTIVLFLWLDLVCLSSLRAQTGLSREHHHWGRFEVGAWSRMRETVENFDESGMLASVSVREILTTVQKIEENKVTLKVESTLEVAGRLVYIEPQLKVYDYSVPLGEQGTVTRHDPKDDKIKIESREVACQVFRYEVKSAQGKSIIVEYRNKKLHPFILRREIVFLDTADKEIARTEVKVISVQMPTRVLDEIKPCATVLKTETNSQGQRVVTEDICLDIPGGMVQYREKELSPRGELTMRKYKELVDYDVEPLKTPAFFRRTKIRPRRVR